MSAQFALGDGPKGKRPLLNNNFTFLAGFNAVLRSAHEARQTTDGDLELEQREHESARRLYAALRAGGLSLTTHRDLAPRQWSKLLINLSNAVSALSGAPTKELLVQAGYRRILAAVPLTSAPAAARRAPPRGPTA